MLFPVQHGQERLLIQRGFQLKIVGARGIKTFRFVRCTLQQRRNVHHRGALRDLLGADTEKFRVADEFIHRAHAEQRQILPKLPGDEQHEPFDVLRLTLEVFAQLRILCRNAHRAAVLAAQAHHFAAERDERCGGKAEFLRAEHTGDRHVGAGHELAIHLQPHA